MMISQIIQAQRDEIIKKIKGWLDEIDNRYREIDEKSGDTDIAIVVQGRLTDDIEQQQYFIEFKTNQDHFWINTYLKFDESDKIGYKLLLPENRKKLMIMLKKPLLLLNLGYNFVSVKEYQLLSMQKLVYFEGFSKQVYFDTVERVLHGYEYVLTIFNEFREKAQQGGKDPFSPV